MSWQDELRRLDEELSAGRLSEAGYRERRDQLVVEAQIAEADAEPETGTEEDNETPQETPAAPPTPAEQTTVIDQPTSLTEKIDPAIGQTQYIGPADKDGTQVIGSGRPIGAGQAPPWGAGRPPAQEPNTGWMMQGPDVFGTGATSRKQDRSVPVLIAAALVLVAAAVGLSYLAWGGDDDSGSDAAPTTVTATANPQADPLAPADLGDGATPATLTFAALGGVRLPPEEFGALSGGGAGDSRLLVSTFAEGSVTVLVTRTAGDPIPVRDTLTTAQAGIGWIGRPPQSGVFVFDQPGPPVGMKAFYAGDGVIVRIEMVGSDPTAINAKFTDVLNAQLRAHPAQK